MLGANASLGSDVALLDPCAAPCSRVSCEQRQSTVQGETTAVLTSEWDGELGQDLVKKKKTRSIFLGWLLETTLVTQLGCPR